MSSTDAREQPTGAAADEPAATGGAAEAAPPGQSGGHRRHPGRWVAAGVVVVLAAGVGAALAAGMFSKPGRGSGSSANSGYRTSTATVERGSLTSQSVVDATLGKAGTWSVVVPQSSSSSSSSSLVVGERLGLDYLAAAGGADGIPGAADL